MALFVSYTRQDEALVRALKDDLERVGRSVWLDHQIHGGERWWQEIIQQIQDAEVFLFALSKDSWRSRPCRAELRYAEQLQVPIIPVRVGPLDNLRIPLAEQQIIDYRERSADVVINLIAAVTGLSAQQRQLPAPLPEPPEMPFEYLYRIAGLIDVQQIPPDDQGQLIAELRRRLKTEEDDGARNDILLLLGELRARNELTVSHAAEIDEIFSGIQVTKVSPAKGGATRLSPADHWRRSRPGSDPAGRPRTEASSPSPSGPAPAARIGPSGAEAPQTPGRTAARTSGSSASSDGSSRTEPSGQSGEDAGKEPPERASEQSSTSAHAPLPSSSPRPDARAWWPTAGSGDGAAPKEEGPKKENRAPDWLTDLINRGGGAETGAGATGAGTAPRTSPRPSDPPPRARKWWPEEQSAPESPAAPTARPPTPSAQPATPQPPSLPAPPPSSHRFAFVQAVLGAMGRPRVLLIIVGLLIAIVVVAIELS